MMCNQDSMCNYISCDISPETLNSTSSIVFYWNSTFNPGLNTELPGVCRLWWARSSKVIIFLCVILITLLYNTELASRILLTHNRKVRLGRSLCISVWSGSITFASVK